MKEMKMYVSLSSDNKVLLAVPVNKAIGTVAATQIMTARLFTQEEVDGEAAEAMQDGVRTYKKYHRRVRETR